MSHSFYLDNVSALKVDDISGTAGYDDLKFLDGYAVPQNGHWPEGVAYLFRDRVSVRPLEVDYGSSAIQIRIFAGSSTDDYRLAVDLACAIAKLYEVELRAEDTDVLPLDEFRQRHDDEWMKKHCADCLSMVLRPRAEPDTVASIAGVHREMRIGRRMREQFPRDKDDTAADFFQRFRKLNYIDQEDIFQGSIMVLANESGDKKVRLSSYAETVPTLLQEKKTLVALSSESDLTNSEDKQQIMIGLEDLATLLGEQAVWLSEDLVLLPGLHGADWQNLLEQAKARAVNDLFDYGYDPDNDPYGSEAPESPDRGGSLDADDIKTLAYAPVAVFCIVAGADGNIDKKEIRAFQKEVLTGVVTESELLQRVMVQVVTEFETLIKEFLNREIDAREKLGEILSIINTKLGDREALEFKLSLFGMGKSVAEASGGFLGFGSRISKQEKEALAGLAAFFGLMK